MLFDRHTWIFLIKWYILTHMIATPWLRHSICNRDTSSYSTVIELLSYWELFPQHSDCWLPFEYFICWTLTYKCHYFWWKDESIILFIAIELLHVMVEGYAELTIVTRRGSNVNPKEVISERIKNIVLSLKQWQHLLM